MAGLAAKAPFAVRVTFDSQYLAQLNEQLV
jgi:hypothetical protein